MSDLQTITPGLYRLGELALLVLAPNYVIVSLPVSASANDLDRAHVQLTTAFSDPDLRFVVGRFGFQVESFTLDEIPDLRALIAEIVQDVLINDPLPIGNVDDNPKPRGKYRRG